MWRAPDRDDRTDNEKRAAIESMFAQYQKSFPDVPTVSPAQVQGMLKDDRVVLVDARTPEERAVSVIPGSISKEQFDAHRDSYAHRKVVAYCTIGYRSGEYAEALREDGLDAYNLKGSILSWVHDGGKVVDPEGRETHTVHVYGEEWNLLPEGYTAVW